jgi:hypothetical protein
VRKSVPGATAILNAALCAIAIAGSLSSCGGKPPELTAVEWRVERRVAKAGDFESLSVFATVKDDDGIEDIISFWVINDAEALAWNFSNENWTKRNEGSDVWLGAAGLEKHDYSALPRGEYRFMAMDQAGERTEKIFRIEGSFPDLATPVPGIAGDRLTVRSVWPETIILGYDAAGALIAAVPIPEGVFEPATPTEIFGPAASGLAEFVIYGYDPAKRMGAYSWRQKPR